MPGRTAIVWFRSDLRLHDNPLLIEALDAFDTIVPIFIWPRDDDRTWAMDGAGRWWLHHALMDLQQSLRSLGSNLFLRSGSALSELRSVLQETDAEAVFWTRRYEPQLHALDQRVREALQRESISCHVIDQSILHDVDGIRTSSGDPYRVFTPFWNRLKRELRVPLPLQAPDAGSFSRAPELPTVHLDSLGLLETRDAASDLGNSWDVNEDAAHRILDDFVEHKLLGYPVERDRPDLDGTSRLSPYLRFGMVSPAQVWHRVSDAATDPDARESVDSFLRQMGWREFAYHLLHHFPSTVSKPLYPKFAAFHWRSDPRAFDAWTQGRTGYPFVDAGMRQLLHTGWMHNRLRMVTASFLTKDLLLPWQDGARWFSDRLVDADLANNTLGWQWSAGCGADAQPFFRIFNPISQGKKFDPQGHYVRQWVAELAELPAKHIHEPWKAKDDVLLKADVRLGDSYPEPIVDHGAARQAALAEYERVR